MKYYFKRKIGKETHTFVSEGKNLFEMVQDSKKVSFDAIYKCGCCGSDDLKLDSHIAGDEGYEYVYVRCKSCNATLNFGQQKKDKDIFYPRLKDSETEEGKKVLDWKKYEPKQ